MQVKKTQWQAQIARGEGVVDNTSRMSYLVAEIKDPYALTDGSHKPLRFGAYVNADIYGLTLASATTVPRYLVDNERIAILDSESKLRYVNVDIVRQDGASLVIGGGLNQGDRIIVSALDYPVDGMALALESDKQDSDDGAEASGETQVASVAAAVE